MRLTIAAVGRLKAGPERQLVERYVDRIDKAGRAVALGPVAIREFAEARADRMEDRRKAETDMLLGAAEGAGRLIALDERGKAVSSATFAGVLERFRDDGIADTAFLIGGADGHDESLRDRADLVLSFGPMTFPHQFVRLMLVEQLYRAVTILAGHPYHRE
ncbi:MAG: 23S rRNA (pseudouridine(1915)-N(3))-methyltransferase RlmH [Hyphomicrobiales bacterium]